MLALVLLMGVAVVSAVFGLWLLAHRWQRRVHLEEMASMQSRGFEVKLITGETPVPPDRKDNDHG
jgi:hypothetical protein